MSSVGVATNGERENPHNTQPIDETNKNRYRFSVPVPFVLSFTVSLLVPASLYFSLLLFDRDEEDDEDIEN